MFIIELTYKVPIEKIEEHLAAHVSYLDKYYASGNFIASGRKVPRDGGFILAKAPDKKAVESIISEDPFYIHALSDYKIIEIIATRKIESLTALQD